MAMFRHVASWGIPRLFGKSKSVIAQLAGLHSQTGDVKMRWGHGRHRNTTVHQDRFLWVIALVNQFVTKPELKQEIHTATGLRFSNSGLKARPPFLGIMSRVNIWTCLQWCQQHQGWPIHWWRHVMFSDDLSLCL